MSPFLMLSVCSEVLRQQQPFQVVFKHASLGWLEVERG